MNKAECVFVAPRPWEESERDHAAITRAWQDLCAWLSEKSSGRFLAALEVRSHPYDGQITSENVAQVCQSLHATMDRAHRVFLVRETGAFAGAFWYGAAILGDACIDELAEVPRPTACDELVRGDRWTCSRNGQIGALLHELGHLYGLEHEDGGFMAHYKTWPDVEIPTRALEVMFVPSAPGGLSWWRRLLRLLARPFGWLRRLLGLAHS